MKDSEGNEISVGDVLIQRKPPHGIPVVFEEINKRIMKLRMEKWYKKENPPFGTLFCISQEDFSVSDYIKRDE